MGIVCLGFPGLGGRGNIGLEDSSRFDCSLGVSGRGCDGKAVLPEGV